MNIFLHFQFHIFFLRAAIGQWAFPGCAWPQTVHRHASPRAGRHGGLRRDRGARGVPAGSVGGGGRRVPRQRQIRRAHGAPPARRAAPVCQRRNGVAPILFFVPLGDQRRCRPFVNVSERVPVYLGERGRYIVILKNTDNCCTKYSVKKPDPFREFLGEYFVRFANRFEPESERSKNRVPILRSDGLDPPSLALG